MEECTQAYATLVGNLRPCRQDALHETPERHKGVEGLVSYLAKHVGRVNYRLRLHQGRSIDSGMTELSCLKDSSQWANYWVTA